MTKTVAGNTTQYFYDEQGHLTGEYDASGQLIQEIIWLGDLPVAVLKPATPASPTATADIYYIHADHLGTPRKITRPNDNRVVWSWESEVFGNSLPDQNPAGLGNFVFNLRFPGQYYDQETGLFYNYFRDYDPAKGRYIESDPIGLAGGVNTYGYVGGNPVNWIDPWGLEPNVPYPNVRAAGEQAIRDINPTSIRQGVEYAGRLCGYADGSCFYTPPNKGGKALSYAGICPKDTSPQGHYHTHGNYDKRYDNENFSELDKTNLDKGNLTGFLGTPKGLIKTYTPIQGSPLGGNVETIGRGAK